MLRSIAVHHFRNLGDAVWQPGDGPHLLVGPNGAGKTSLLEAVYLLATSRSFRTSRLEECRRFDTASFRVSGSVETQARSDLEVLWTTEGRQLRLNGKTTTGSRYLEALPVISWSSADLKVIEGGPQHRRRFLDQGVVAGRPAAVEVLSRYRRSLEQKRQVLRHRAQGLEVWNEVMSKAASELIRHRADFARVLAASLAQVVAQSEMKVPEIRLEYRPSPTLVDPTPDAVFEALEAHARREQEDGRVLVGPHRDELEITWGGIEISKVASAGEKKLVGILLSAARREVLSAAGRQPVVLLDDVDAELDPDRLRTAWRLFSDAPQIFATSCHESILTVLPEARFWRLENGHFESSRDS